MGYEVYVIWGADLKWLMEAVFIYKYDSSISQIVQLSKQYLYLEMVERVVIYSIE